MQNKIETGLYVGERSIERLCSVCNNSKSLEDGQHFFTTCTIRDDMKTRIFDHVLNSDLKCLLRVANKLVFLINVYHRKVAKYLVKSIEKKT